MSATSPTSPSLKSRPHSRKSSFSLFDWKTFIGKYKQKRRRKSSLSTHSSATLYDEVEPCSTFNLPISTDQQPVPFWLQQGIPEEQEINEYEELTPALFAQLAGLKIVAQTDTEDDFLQASQDTCLSLQQQVTDLSEHHLTVYSESNTIRSSMSSVYISSPRKIDLNFFEPPEPFADELTSLHSTAVDSSKHSDSSCSTVLKSQSFVLLPTGANKENVTHTHVRSQSEGRPGIWVPPSNTKNDQPASVSIHKGRFVITRETVESSHWKPKTRSGTSRFQIHGNHIK